MAQLHSATTRPDPPAAGDLLVGETEQTDKGVTYTWWFGPCDTVLATVLILRKASQGLPVPDPGRLQAGLQTDARGRELDLVLLTLLALLGANLVPQQLDPFRGRVSGGDPLAFAARLAQTFDDQAVLAWAAALLPPEPARPAPLPPASLWATELAWVD